MDRTGDTSVGASVSYRSVGASVGGEARAEGSLHFAPGQVDSYVRLALLAGETAFYVVLVDPSAGAACGPTWSCAVVAQQERSAGMLRFEHEQMSVKESAGVLWVRVLRVGGAHGKVGFRLRTRDVSAVGGTDYVPIDCHVLMASGQTEHAFPVHVYDDEVYENDEAFQLVLDEPSGGVGFDPTADGGAERAVGTVTIISDEAVRRKVDELAALLQLNGDSLALSADTWGQQLADALAYDGERCTWSGAAMHALALPWKLAFALLPPPRLGGGWACFFGALVGLGALTAAIGDLASHMGCCMGLSKSVTAITFVALGTSLPDTFASRTAALGEPHADASIGNITGSNAVNVFLGLGLPWAVAAAYWAYFRSEAAAAAWHARYASAPWYTPDAQTAFVVQADDLGFSVGVFSAGALACLLTLALRRAVLGYELGGPRGYAVATATFFVLLWVAYVALSVAYTYGAFH